MIAVVIVSLLIASYAIGSGEWKLSKRGRLLFALAPIALFPAWAGLSWLGFLAAALLSDGVANLGHNLGAVEERPLVHRGVPLGAWVYDKYGEAGGTAVMLGELILGTLIIWLI